VLIFLPMVPTLFLMVAPVQRVNRPAWRGRASVRRDQHNERPGLRAGGEWNEFEEARQLAERAIQAAPNQAEYGILWLIYLKTKMTDSACGFSRIW
jgi:hypothetical protein